LVAVLVLAALMPAAATAAAEIRYEFGDPDAFWDGEILNDTGKHYLDVKSGWLTVRTQMGGWLGEDCDAPPNLFYVPIEWDASVRYVVETRIDFLPKSNYQIAGPILFRDVDNFVMLGRAFCSIAGLTEPCIGDAIYFDHKEGGEPFPTVSTNHGSDPGEDAGREVWLRLEVCGAHADAYYSLDGDEWVFLGRHVIGFGPTAAGFGAWNSCTRAPAIYAHFDYFSLRIDEQGCSAGD